MLADAEVEVASAIRAGAKVSRPGVCNAAECVVVDRAIAATAVPKIVAALRQHNVEVRGDVDVCALVADVKAAVAADFDTEFLALTMAMAVVDGEAAALAFLRRHGTNHTATIITREHDAAMRFVRAVDASCVLVNASTRFNDGGELGLGAELGISTTKLHAYGPMGLEELCARKFVVFGAGETRGTP
jgi:glutamate-5-semialdehyde dehydrogenase